MESNTRTCICYHREHGSQTERSRRAPRLQRESHDLHGVHAPLPDERRLPRIPQGTVLPRRDGVPELPQVLEVPPDQGALGLLLPVLRTPRLPDRRDDLPQVDDEPPALVLGDLPNVVHAVRASGQAPGARDRRELQDGASHVQADSNPLGRRRVALRPSRDRRDLHGRTTRWLVGRSPRPERLDQAAGLGDGRAQGQGQGARFRT